MKTEQKETLLKLMKEQPEIDYGKLFDQIYEECPEYLLELFEEYKLI